MIRYRIYPDNPKATIKSRSDACLISLFGFIVFITCIFSILYYISSAIELFEKNNWEKYIYAIGFFLLSGFLTFLLVVIIRNTEKVVNWLKYYILYFFSGLIGIVGLTGVVGSVFLLSKNEPGTISLLGSIGIVVLNIFFCWLIRKKFKGHKICLYTDNEEKEEILKLLEKS